MNAALRRRFRPRRHVLRDEAGATGVEYGLIIALVAVVIIGAVTALGTSVLGGFDEVVRAANRCDHDRGSSAETPAFDNVGGPGCHQ